MQPRCCSLYTYEELEALSNCSLKSYAVRLYTDVCSAQEDPETRKNAEGHSRSSITRVKKIREIVGILRESEDELDNEAFSYLFNPAFGTGPANAVAEIFQKYFLARGRTPGSVEATISIINQDDDSVAATSVSTDPAVRAAQILALEVAITRLNVDSEEHRSDN